MKLIIVLMTTCLMQVSAAGFAQKLTYVKKGATLEQIFSEIRKQTGYFVVYAEDKVDKQARLDVNFRQAQLKDVLDVVSKSQNLNYTINENNIGLKPKEQEGFLDNIIARFQSIDVRGKVVDSLGNGLAGATVSVKGGKQSTQTLANGDFYLKSVEEGAVLTVQYLGYVTKEEKATMNFIHIQLSLSTSKLDEVQIMAYGQTSRRTSTGNITTLKSSDITKQVLTNPLLALQGRVPNLVITPSNGLPDSQVKLQLRGQNSLSQLTSEPLIVVDGVPVNHNLNGYGNGSFNLTNISALSYLNVNNIESIDVLTDADATSIYGSRGGNGVIIITTKKGKSGPTNIDVSTSTGFNTVNKRIDLLNTQQYLEMRTEAYKNDGLIIPDINTPVSARDIQNYDLTVWDQNRYTDWQKTVLGGTAHQYNFQGSISGGIPTIQYLISGNYDRMGYVFPGESKTESGSGHFNIAGQSSNGKFRLSLTGDYVGNTSKSTGGDFMMIAMALAPNAPSIYKNGTYNWEPDPESGLSTWGNPFASILNVASSKMKTARGIVDLNYDFLDNFSFKTSFGFSEANRSSYSPVTIASQDPSNTSARGSAGFQDGLSQSVTLDPQLHYKEKILQGTLDALIGSSWQSQSDVFRTISAGGYISDAFLKDISKAESGNIFVSNSSSQYKSFSFFSRLNYNWLDKYIINLNVRRDGSSRFGPKNPFGNYWSLGSAWLFSNESFVKHNIEFLSFGKFRASYGSNGNDAIGDYKYLELFESYTGISYQGITPIRNLGAINPYYSWEDIRKSEFAVELGFLKDRILTSVSYWLNRSSNQLGSIDLPVTAGATGLVTNQPAKIQNSGWDFLITSKNIVSTKFTWVTNLNFGFQRNKLLSLPEQYTGYFLTYQYYKDRNQSPVGHPFSGKFIGYEFKGINSEKGTYEFSKKEGGIAEYAFEAYQNAKMLNVSPLIAGGVSNSVSYKGVTLDFFVQITKQKGKNYLFDPIFGNPFVGTNYGIGQTNRPKDVMSRWQKPGDNSLIQRFTSQGYAVVGDQYIEVDGPAFNASNSDLAWVDASFIRLKNISISYDIPGDWKKKMRVKNASFILRGQNLFTITGYKGFDPETQSLGVIPQLRSVVAGVNLSF
ncbi:SusC/RagA family TonB-linked outer membrane protein [Pedobacter sp. JY14-1]|uniref:SusC/RagA family TonB-linked outer membrane protein n=1 Tax=Pedobacter sp. JY14-1 TaxID=3034151 RepID=UPI0023E1B932|nr:SusC/RagA family TonB-linked outer membrane protein [Pedobacter sp. JY14-1]